MVSKKPRQTWPQLNFSHDDFHVKKPPPYWISQQPQKADRAGTESPFHSLRNSEGARTGTKTPFPPDNRLGQTAHHLQDNVWEKNSSKMLLPTQVNLPTFCHQTTSSGDWMSLCLLPGSQLRTRHLSATLTILLPVQIQCSKIQTSGFVGLCFFFFN